LCNRAGIDSDGNGVINAADAGMAALSVWRDRDGDGVTDAGELVSLASLGINSVNPAGAVPGEASELAGVTIDARSTVGFSDGSSAAMAGATEG
jgi:hypothetical protein